MRLLNWTKLDHIEKESGWSDVLEGGEGGLIWWAQRDLNPRPSDYESPALTAELWAREGARIMGRVIFAARSFAFLRAFSAGMPGFAQRSGISEIERSERTGPGRS